MILAIVLCVLLYVVIAAMMMLIPCIKRKSSIKGRKIYFDTNILNPSFIVSRLLWSLVGWLALIYCASLLIPLFWMVNTSLKGPFEYTVDLFGVVKKPFWSNYTKILPMIQVKESDTTYGLPIMLFNSFYHAFVGPLQSNLWMFMVAYVIARVKFKGGQFIYNLGLVIMLIPLTGSTAATMIFKQKIGLYDKLYLSDIIPPSTPFSGIYFMMLYSALKAIPVDYSDAARIDGAGEYRIMFQIIFPMVLPTIATFFLLAFINAWNLYEDFLVWYPSTPNLAYGLWRFQSGTGATAGANGATIPMILAGFVIAMIPTMAIYLSAQGLISSKFTVGGLKG